VLMIVLSSLEDFETMTLVSAGPIGFQLGLEVEGNSFRRLWKHLLASILMEQNLINVYSGGSNDGRTARSYHTGRRITSAKQHLNYILRWMTPKICVRTWLVHLTVDRSARKGRLTYMNRSREGGDQ
jgi:hypothetical protein